MTPRVLRLAELSGPQRALVVALLAQRRSDHKEKAGQDDQRPQPAKREGTRDAQSAA
jgi:hypothetical protein